MKKFIDCYVPTETCNLKCPYCYIAQTRKFNNRLPKFPVEVDTIRKALSVQRLGGKCMINICSAGETLLSEEMIPLIQALLEEGHYLMVVTNGTVTKRFQQVVKFPEELRKHLFFKFSLHYLEFKRLNILDRFTENVKMIDQAGCSFTVEVTPYDDLIPYIDELKEYCMANFGALPHITIARDDRTSEMKHLSGLKFQEYANVWGTFNSELFDFKKELFQVKRKEFCYAGDWFMLIDLFSGNVRPCYTGPTYTNIYQDLNSPIKTFAMGRYCETAYCFNGHSILAFGTIPELNTPCYSTLRDRVTVNNTHWVKPEMKAFMDSRLSEKNAEYSKLQQILNDVIHSPREIKRKLRK